MIIDGKQIAQEQLNIVKNKLQSLDISPTLMIIQVGDDYASTTYIQRKINACHATNITTKLVKLDEHAQEETVIKLVQQANLDLAIQAILIQLPLPQHINTPVILNTVLPSKDPDCLTYQNLGHFYLNPLQAMMPPTTQAIMLALNATQTCLVGKKTLIVGFGLLVGKPITIALTCHGTTTTICHRTTQHHHLVKAAQEADIIISGTGKPDILDPDWFKQGVIVIDVGICRDHRDKIRGDIDTEKAKQKAAFITATPGGIGPLTVACLISNILKLSIHD